MFMVVRGYVSKGERNSNVVEVVVNLCSWWYLVFEMLLCGFLHNCDTAIGKCNIIKFVVVFVLKFELSGCANGEGCDGFVMSC